MSATRLSLAARLSAWPPLLAVYLYRATLSPWLGGQCRYAPTCSRYAIDALREYGGFRGAAMAAGRVLRCHPLARGGYDPVPPRE